MLTNKRPHLPLLAQELAAAGVDVSRGLGCYGLDDADTSVNVHTYTARGEVVDLPTTARAVVDAHQPPDAPTPPDYGNDAPADFDRQAAAAVANLRAYLALTSPTGAQTIAALKLVIRVVLFLARRAL